MHILVKQTDFKDPKVRGYGCLMADCMTIPQLHLGRILMKGQWWKAYQEALKQGAVITNDKYWCWVMDRCAIGNIALADLGRPDLEMVETGREYYAAYFKKYPQHIGQRAEGMTGERGDFSIDQREVVGKSWSHYVMQDYDPYHPYLRLGALLSQSWYTIKER